MIVDEAQHLLDDPQSIRKNLGILKSLINRTKMTVVLIGTYRQAIFLSKLVELIRRTKTLDFPRYDVVHRKGDAAAFGTLLLKLAEYSGVPELKDLVLKYPRLFFVGSLGLIGMLKPWFIQACAVARLERTVVKVEHFQRTLVSAQRRDDLLRDIEEGERLFRTNQALEDVVEA